MYDTLRSISHVLDGCYIPLLFGFVYFCYILVIIDTILMRWKDKMIIDYILDWFEKHKKKRRKKK